MTKEILITLSQMPEWVGNLVVAIFTIIATGVGWLVKYLCDARKEEKRPYEQDVKRYEDVLDACNAPIIKYFSDLCEYLDFQNNLYNKIMESRHYLDNFDINKKPYINDRLPILEGALVNAFDKFSDTLAAETRFKSGSMERRTVLPDNYDRSNTVHVKDISDINKSLDVKSKALMRAYMDYKNEGARILARKLRDS